MRMRWASRESFRTGTPAMSFCDSLCGRLRTGLASLFLEPFAGQADAFLFVRVRRTQAANVCRNLPDLAFVGAADHQMGLLIHADVDSLGNREDDGMRIPETEVYRIALQLGAKADAHNVQFLLEALRNAVDGVGHQRPGQSVQRALLFSLPDSRQHAVFLLQANAARQRHAHLSLGSLHIHAAGMYRHVYPGRNRNRLASYA